MDVNMTTVQNNPVVQNQIKKKKRHGNRKDQRFRRKCRAKGMKARKIEKLLRRRKLLREKKKNPTVSAVAHITTSNNEPSHKNVSSTEINSRRNLTKRKRDISVQDIKSTTRIPKSISSISVAQPKLRRMKRRINLNIATTTIMNNAAYQRYQRPMYLIRSPMVLIKMLTNIINHNFKKKEEQLFLYIGIQQHRWPDQLYAMAKTNDFQICRQYLDNHINTIMKEIDTCHMQLNNQAQSCPLTTLTLDRLDHYLEEFVDCQRKYLSIRNNKQLPKFIDNFHQNELFETISTYHLNNIDQNQYINRLMSIREKQATIYEELLMLEMRVLYKFLPKNFDQLERFIAPMIYLPLNNDQKMIEVRNKRYKTIQEAKRIWLNVFLKSCEVQLQEYDQQYENEFLQLQSHLHDNVNMNGSCVYEQIQQHMNYQTNKLKQQVSIKIQSLRGILIRNRRRSSSAKNTVGVWPEPYLDLLKNVFNRHEWNYLSFGPSCIRINQSAIRPRHQQDIAIQNDYKSIYDKVRSHLNEHYFISMTATILKQYSNHLLHDFNFTYFSPLSYHDQILTLNQAKTKAQNFFQDTNAFIELKENLFNKIQDNFIHLLNQIRAKKFILQWQCNKMMPNRIKCQLPHLYFNPKTHKDGIPVRPIENTIHGPTTDKSNYLDEIIRPIFDKECQDTTIIDGVSLIQALHQYMRKGLFKSTTLFCTFDIRNLYTMLPQEEALNILVEFLHVHGYTKVKGIPLETIRLLASIVLKENVFVYGKKIYQQVLGGAMGSSFTLTLANIFMWKWQKELVRRQDMTCEYYGRYIDDVFMTWNKSENVLKQILENANNWHTNIKLEYKIGKSLPFLDILFTNINGTLSTSVYHKPAAEPYVVPFISDHPRHVFENIVQTSLRRAIKYSSTFQLFNDERRYIKSTFLYNGYPSSFIDKIFRKFFSGYISSRSFLPFLDNEAQFLQMRIALSGQPSRQQSQVEMRIATLTTDNEHLIEELDKKPEFTIQEKKKPNQFQNKLIIHYAHEKRFNTRKRDLHRIFEETFANTPILETKLIVGNRNQKSTMKELIRKRPRQAVLKNKAKANENRKKKAPSTEPTKPTK
ncbi:unnamed protein product [Rotaria magnacalcarata]|uniref:Reverse transcriptase domain-containing protein n=1 Tax=Rotaria magnacalcarata TaxID=392030 RepID=A0A819VTW2_9BILA|nr:unnamed protein product [Rotaria magnacalcarata]